MVWQLAYRWHDMYNIAPTLGQRHTNLINFREKSVLCANIEAPLAQCMYLDACFLRVFSLCGNVGSTLAQRWNVMYTLKDTQAADTFHNENTSWLKFSNGLMSENVTIFAGYNIN